MKDFKPRMIVIVHFALGQSYVRLLDWNYIYDGETVWHVEDIETCHQDYVGESFMKRLTNN